MTPSRSIIGRLALNRWLGQPWLRRVLVAILAAILAYLTLFPQQYRAAVTLAPTDPSSLGLAGALGQLGASTSVFGAQAALEVSLKVANSMEVRRTVTRKLDLIRRLGLKDEASADRWLKDEVSIRALRGGIIQIDTKLRDAELGTALVGTFADATRARLAEINRAQTGYKRGVLVELVEGASERLAQAQAAYDAFRRRTRYSDPAGSIGAIGARVPALQSQIKTKEVQLRAARSFATDENMVVQQILAEIAALRQQLREAESLDTSDPDSVNRVVTESTQVQRLERELAIARTLYDNYRRFLEGTSVEDLTSTANVRILEPPYVDTSRQFNNLWAALLGLLILIAAAVEFYLLRPPLDAVRIRRTRVA
jgi:uncharacterized protein involved in exopolysaccharide biosynthesis